MDPVAVSETKLSSKQMSSKQCPAKLLLCFISSTELDTRIIAMSVKQEAKSIPVKKIRLVRNLSIKRCVEFVDQNFLCHKNGEETVCQERITHMAYKIVHSTINV